MQIMVTIGSGVLGIVGIEFPTFPLTYIVVVLEPLCSTAVLACDQAVVRRSLESIQLSVLNLNINNPYAFIISTTMRVVP